MVVSGYYLKKSKYYTVRKDKKSYNTILFYGKTQVQGKIKDTLCVIWKTSELKFCGILDELFPIKLFILCSNDSK